MLIPKERKITKAQYDRAMANRRMLTEEDKRHVFSTSELYGYGIYSTSVLERGGEYFVRYKIGDNCD